MTPLTTRCVLEVELKKRGAVNGERLDGLPARSITGKKLTRSKSKFSEKIEDQGER